jgi:hypothetical protein
MGKTALPDDLIAKVFDKWWPELEAALSKILQSPYLKELERSDEDMIKEVLETVRDQHKILSKMLENRISYPDFVVESRQNKVDTIRLTPNAAFNPEFLKQFTSYNYWQEAIADIKKSFGEDINSFDFVFSDWPEVIESHMGFTNWYELRDAAIHERAKKNVKIEGKLW